MSEREREGGREREEREIPVDAESKLNKSDEKRASLGPGEFFNCHNH